VRLTFTCILAGFLCGCGPDKADPAVAELRQGLSRLNRRIDSVADALKTSEAMHALEQPGIVDLHENTLQTIGGGFSVGRLQVAREPGGARVSGMLVNTQSVGHSSATFELTTLGQSKEFTVMELPAGGSSRFQVVVLDVNPDSARYGIIKYVRSTISYH